MCGIFGIVGPEPAPAQLIEVVHGLQAHRGPDGRGSWTGRLGAHHLTLAAQRLAIIDLSPNASQPFRSTTTGSVLVFNGEIYNYVELRSELAANGVAFKTTSDTEVLLAVLDHYGIEEALPRLNGMFAFAWFCGRTGKLWLARDRVGQKPLYWWQDGATLAFASEIKTLLPLAPAGSFKPNLKVVRNFLVDGIADDSEQTFFSGVHSLRPAQYAELATKDGSLEMRTLSYWPRAADQPSSRQSIERNAEECLAHLKDSLRIRLRSDVPIGFLLSGGIDSSILTALAIEIGIDREQVRSFSIVNPRLDDDETRWIDLISRHLKIQPNKIVFDPGAEDLCGRIEKHVYFHDEPLTTVSLLAHGEMMRQARERGVTVLMSGQGGDELFCGYSKYVYFYIQWLLRERRPLHAAQVAWGFVRNGTVFQSFSPADAARYVSIPLPGVAQLPLGSSLAACGSGTSIGLRGGNIEERQIADLLRFSAPSLNHIEDRTSMSMSREVRSPFFDPRVMEFALALPPDQKLQGGWTKHVLRRAGQRLLPEAITWRKEKVGHFTATRRWLVERGGERVRSQLHAKSPIFVGGFLDANRMMPLWNAFWGGGPSNLSVAQVIRVLSMDVWLRTFSRSLSL